MTTANVITIKKIKALDSGWSTLMQFPKTGMTKGVGIIRQGFYNTGLTEEEEKVFEKDLGLKEGTLKKTNVEYWHNFVLFRDRGSLIKLRMDDPEDRLRYKLCLADPKIADNLVNIIDFPEAIWVITDEVATAKASNLKGKWTQKAWAKFDGMTTEDHKNVLKLMGKKEMNSTSGDILEAAVRNIVESNPQEFVELISDSKFTTKLFIEELRQAGILRKNATTYIYGDEPIGHDLESTIIYLESPANNNQLVNLKAALEKFKKKSLN